ncbi:MAG: hypothetical protein M1835_003790 [Candelina submexicana]|nr:MAG: hypothetical protein M1835_003790 [Candelina submexicana]
MPLQEVHSEDSHQLQDIADLLGGSKKVIVITGAGISTNCGIPDFRSENGLYALIQEQYDLFASQGSKKTLRSTLSTSLTASKIKHHNRVSAIPSNMKGKDLFDAALWKNSTSTSVFYTFIASLRKKIREEVGNSTTTHRFIRALRDGGRVIRCYTQNIDGLEERDGFCTDMARGKGVRTRFTKKVTDKPRPDGQILPGSEMDGGCEVVELHGNLRELRCNLCQSLCSWEDDDRETRLLSGEAPSCPACVSKSGERQNRGKRGTVIGTLRPNIVLYGEEHPASQLLASITTHDLGLAPEFLLIMGTSLKVHGLKNLVKEFAKAVHGRAGRKGRVIFVNLTKPAESVWGDILDYWVGMDCDAWVDDLKERRGDLWLRQGELKLPIAKDTTYRKGKARKAKATIQDTAGYAIAKSYMNESDKENLAAPLGGSTKSSPRKKTSATKKISCSPVAGSKARTSKSIFTTSKPQLASSSDPSGNAKVPQKLLLKPAMPRALPNTPSRKLESLDTPLQQLPTPPHSGRSQIVAPKSAKRTCEILYDDEDPLQSTPTKRRKQAVQVWVDPISEWDNDQAKGSLPTSNSQSSAWSSEESVDGGSSVFCNKRQLRPPTPGPFVSSLNTSLGEGDDTSLKREQIVTVEIPQRRAPGTPTANTPLRPLDQLPVSNALHLRAFAVAFVDSHPTCQQTGKLDLVMPADISWAKFIIQVALALGNIKCRAFSEAKQCEVKLAHLKRSCRFRVESRNVEGIFASCTKKATGTGIVQVTFHV